MDVRGPKFVEGSVDREIARIARRQHGVVAGRQLEALGLSARGVSHRAAAGRLHRIHQGVYAVGHTVLGPRGHWMAAVLACGTGAALSHRAAAALWDIRRSDPIRIDVIVPTAGGRARPGLRIHRHPTLRRDEITTLHGIPVTTPARTVLDLAGTLDTDALHRALDRTEILELTDYPALHAMARVHPSHRGAGPLRQALERYRAGTVTRSHLERLFLSVCRRHGLPPPIANAQIHGFEVDFLFAAQRLVVETDGWRYHRTRRAFERDRDRDAALLMSGYRTLRVTHHRLRSDPAGVAATLRALLGA